MWLRAALAIAILLGICFRFYHLERKTFWEDEILGTIHTLGYTEAQVVQAAPQLRDAASVQAYFRVAQPAVLGPAEFAATVGSLAAEDPQHPPLYYLIERLWVGAFGPSVASMRALPALFGVLALVAMYWLAVELFESRGVAWNAVALLAVSPFAVLYSQEAREYTLWTVTVLASGALLLRAVRTRSTAMWLAYALCSVAGLYIYPFAAFVTAGQGAYLILTGDIRRRDVALWFVGACGLAALAFAPWFRIMSASGGLTRGMSGILAAKTSPLGIVVAFARDLKSTFVDIGFFRLGPLHSTAINAAATLAVAALTGFAAYVLARNGGRRAAAFVLGALTIPALPIVLHDLLRGGGLIQQARYLIPAYLAAILAVAYAFDFKLREAVRGPDRRGAWSIGLTAVLAVGLFSCALSSAASTWWNKDYERTPDVAALVDAAPRPLIVSDWVTSRLLGLSFYLDPRVALDLRLHCEQCAVSPPVRGPLLTQTSGFSDVFVLGPLTVPGAEGLRRIGVQIYPPAPAPLNMFLSVGGP